MCIAILNTTGKLTEETFETCWENNPDGSGLAWAENGQVHTFKEMKSVSVIHKFYSELRDRLPDANILIHFRIATHGKVNETNCHPFKVNNKLAFIHNGMIDGAGLKTSHEFSDTYLFNKLILQQLPKNFINNEAILNLLSEYIGYSKLVFLNSKNDWAIVNMEQGTWDDDNWYSNDSYIPCVKSAPNCKTGKKSKTYMDYGYQGKFGSDFDDVGYTTYGKVNEHSFCDCCREYASTRYVTEFSMEMCDRCIGDWCDYNAMYSTPKVF